MAKVLLVDTNFSSEPIYRILSEMGHEVHVVGNRPNDCLAKISPNYWKLDYTNTDALAKLVEKNQFDFLVPGCTDRSYASCVAVSNGRFPGLDRNESCEEILNKEKFRELAERLGLPVPKRFALELCPFSGPVIVKPVDAFSGKGIAVLRDSNASALKNAVDQARRASPTGRYLIEEFVDGQLHSHTAFIRDGRIIQDFIVQEDSTANPFVVDTSRVLLNMPKSIQEGLQSAVEDISRELSLVDGLFHTQFISNDEDFWLIEITRRCPGDLYSQLIELATDYPYAQAYALPFLGKKIPNLGKALRARPVMRHTVTPLKAQSLAYLRFNLALHIERWIPLSVTGDQLKASPQGRIGIMFCLATDQRDLDRLYQTALHRRLYELHHE